ncbi:MAG TPA: DUF4381 domain-containing protein [Chromatiaceae bacterium]|jgi:hypothetical protein|nr:MAG: hypothetical protein N838_00545 [Thiohalocapsa sp. PB-PSB1]QQO56553.1 MAG: DUF4381 domain-containing protein [Thiohalocapsa sp. PB-PSB1]HBG96564.1 DUF4381 domain-containing protein [Chromatiaceae bacterium]HCS91308.1 DUF4381 domain-containing protein [Chromatiaceae bacterium]
MIDNPLVGLRDYHLPQSASWWPPAPGWWLLAALLLTLIALLPLWRRQRRRRRQASALATRELAALRAAWQADADAGALLRGLSQLVRRFVLVRFPTDRAAGLVGDAWLAYLASKSAETAFIDGIGRALAEAPYRPMGSVAVDVDLAALADLVERLITRNAGEAVERGS